MVEESEQLIEEIRRIKKQYVAEIGSGRRTWPKSIKERIVQLDLMGVFRPSKGDRCSNGSSLRDDLSVAAQAEEIANDVPRSRCRAHYLPLLNP